MSEEKEVSTVKKKRRGFAVMDPAIVKAIASKGGKAAHVVGTAHRFTSEEAREAGRKGGLAPHSVRGRGRPLKQLALIGYDAEGEPQLGDQKGVELRTGFAHLGGASLDETPT